MRRRARRAALSRWHLDTRGDNEFIDDAYRAVLGRPADSGGLAFFADMLREGKSREAVLLELAMSEESVNHRLAEWYSIPSLRELRPERYRDLETVDGKPARVFEAASPDDIDWLERSMLEFGYYEKPGIWFFGIDDDKRRSAEMLAVLGPRSALEIGCSSGAVIRCLQDRGIQADGVEGSAMALQRATPEVSRRIHRGDLLDVDLDRQYDLVYGLDVFQRFNPNRLERYLRRVHDLTAPGGLVYVNVPTWGEDRVYGRIWEPYLQSWREDLDAERMFRQIEVDRGGYPLHGHLIWAGSRWWEARFADAGLRREADVERALHARFDADIQATPSRRAFFVLSRDTPEARLREVIARCETGAAAPPGFAGETFTGIYDVDEWQGGSGQGSVAAHTLPYRRLLQLVLGSSDVHTVVDAGCGDWQVAQMLDWSGVHYQGVDVVRSIVDENERRFGSDSVRFTCLDVLDVDPPPADLLIVKDVLQHWPNDEIRRFLRRMHGRYRYMLLTNDVASAHWPADRTNADIRLGAWRTVDLERTPFSVRPLWRGDYDVARGEWTKRVLLVGDRRRLLAPGSAALRLARFGRRTLRAA